MKKILSIALAVVMLFAVCVPAFAFELNQMPSQSGTTIVKTSTRTETGEDGRKYSVTIPADTVIPWGKAETDMAYIVEAHLAYGEKLNVTVAKNDAMALTEDASVTLPYTLNGTLDYTSATPVVNPAVSNLLTLSITAEDWANAIVGEYSDTLTFTAAIV